MIKIGFLALLMLMVFGNTNSTIENEKVIDNFDVSLLSETGQIAYENLRKAAQFEDTHIGIAGSISEHIKEFGIILKEKNADEAFKSILKSGTKAGQLYGLSGIYFTDYKFFKTAVDKYKNNDSIVMTISGCLVADEKISDVVESNAKNVAIIEPTESIEDFWNSNKGSYQLDISNGGYPATFKHFAEKNIRESE